MRIIAWSIISPDLNFDIQNNIKTRCLQWTSLRFTVFKLLKHKLNPIHLFVAQNTDRQLIWLDRIIYWALAPMNSIELLVTPWLSRSRIIEYTLGNIRYYMYVKIDFVLAKFLWQVLFLLTHRPLGDVVVILRVWSPNTRYASSSWTRVNLLSGEWMPQGKFDDKSTLVAVIACYRQATSHYLGQHWHRSMPPYGLGRQQYTQLSLFYTCAWYLQHAHWPLTH